MVNKQESKNLWTLSENKTKHSTPWFYTGKKKISTADLQNKKTQQILLFCAIFLQLL